MSPSAEKHDTLVINTGQTQVIIVQVRHYGEWKNVFFPVEGVFNDFVSQGTDESSRQNHAHFIIH